ncbi:helix-turn-helix transcriptional regulator [Jannaschia sp. CCS1]|uniref:helix-turn-helix transcriptional regulator n=1 Tax=Jannaschia sp. (strain CCS1) TaxID=290400 RepID=UPI0005C60F1A|nr:helix-turn-helix transcriptional regulator [Jannaschia sp. CCS1]
MTADLLQTINTIYDCVGDELDHHRCLAAIGEAVDGTSLSVGEVFPFFGRIRLIANYCVPEDAARIMVDSFSTIESNSFMKNLPRFPEGVPFMRRTFVSDEEHYQSDIYKLASEPWGLHSEGATIFSKSIVSAKFCGFFRLPGKAELDIHDLSKLAILNGHYMKAMKFQDRISGLETALLRANNVLDLLDFGLLLFGDQKSPLYVNQAAHRILEKSDVMSLGRDGLIFSSSKSQNHYEKIFSSVVGSRSSPTKGTGGLVQVSPASFRRPYNVVVQPISSHQTGVADATIGVLIFDPNAKRTTAIELFSTSYGLTKKETQLALHLAEGLSVDEYAKSHNVSINTVRTHVRSIYEKTNTTRQPELVSLILRLTAGLNWT